MENAIPIVMESQLDWLSLSAHGDERAHGLAWLCSEWAKEEREAGNKPRPWRLLGYVGTQCGRVRWGARDEQSCYVQLSGDLAARHFDEAYPLADQVTRADLAVTARYTPPDPHVGGNSYLQALWHHQEHPHSSLPWRVQNAHGGETVYLGNRESDYFLRIYNKEAESRDSGDSLGEERYRGCWRYELECKSLAAGSVAGSLAASSDRPGYAQSAVYHFIRGHGIEPGFLPGTERVLLPGLRRRSDADTRIKHLARNVRPTLDWLREIGRIRDAMEALGLPVDGTDDPK